jgi:hypothetical protein
MEVKAYVLINADTDAYIGVASPNSDYPYDTDDLNLATIWNNKQEPRVYVDRFPNKLMYLHEVKVSKKPCSWH